jgi:hypothetical protein
VPQFTAEVGHGQGGRTTPCQGHRITPADGAARIGRVKAYKGDQHVSCRGRPQRGIVAAVATERQLWISKKRSLPLMIGPRSLLGQAPDPFCRVSAIESRPTLLS